MKYGFLFLLFPCFFTPLKAQKLDWFALNDCANIISTKFLEVDSAGNSYIVGQFQGETFFHSASPDGLEHHTYTSTSWKRTFLLKYDTNGNLLYFINMYGTNGNGNYAEPRAFIRLSDGRLALAAYTDIGIYIKDAEKTEHTIRGNKQMMLLVFSPEGTFLSGTPLGLKNATKIIEEENGKLYFLGTKKSYSREIPAIFSLEHGENELNPLPVPDSAVIDIEIENDNLWFLTSDEATGRFRRGKQSFSLYEIRKTDTTQRYFKHFTQPFEGHRYANVYLINQLGNIEVALQLVKQENAILRLGEFIADFFKTNGIYIYQSNGQIKTQLDLDLTLGNLFKLKGREKGGYLATAYARENFCFIEKDCIEVQPQPNYRWERFIMVFDPLLKLQAYSSTASSHTQQIGCFPREHKGEIYYSAPLIDFGHFAGEYKELNWKAGFYVAKFSQLAN